MLAVGTILGDRYEILEAIGSGGMADVYKAKCHKLNRFVAIKVLKSEFSSDSVFVSKFKAEAQAAAGLMHPNIVNVYDVGEENGLYYFVMELVEGITLKKYIEKKIRLTIKESVSIALQVSMGIEAAHNNGIIHRDIKPQNIIISKEGKVKVADFGIAKAASSNTVTSHAMGSVHYTSPEQARGGYSDAKSDIYSIGITLFEMVTGHVPFDGETTVAVAIKHIQEEMPSPRIYVPDVPISVEQIINKCCQKNPDRRYQNVGQLIRDLKHSLSAPDEDFVVINEPASNEGTKNIDDVEKAQIRNRSVMSGTVYDEFLPGRAPSASTPVRQGERADAYAADGYTNAQQARAAGYPQNGLNGYQQSAEGYPQSQNGYSNGGNYGSYADNYNEGYEEVFEPRRPKTRADGSRGANGAYSATGSMRQERMETAPMRNNGKKNQKQNNNKDRNYYRERQTDYYEDGIEDDVDPKMEKAVTILLVVVAVIIAIVAVLVVGNILGLFHFGSSDSTASNGELKIETSSENGDTVTVPDIVGMTVEEATEALSSVGLSANATKQESTEYDAGYIISQDVAGGTQIPVSQKLNLVVSSGKVTGTAVPDVVGLSEAEAKVKLEAEGFTMQKQLVESNDVEAGNVISQNPLGATTATTGSAVTVVISSGTSTKQVEMPDLTGKTEEEAKVIIDEAGLIVRTVSEQNSDTVEEGKIMSQSPSAGGTVEEGTSVDLVVSLGKEISTYTCSVNVDTPNNYLVGSEAIIVLMTPQGTEISRYNVNSFPYTINETGIEDIDSGLVTVTYLSNEGTWDTTTPVAVTFTPEG